MSAVTLDAGARLLVSGAGPQSDLRAHLAVHGALDIPARADTGWTTHILQAIDASGLRGRGGASFPRPTNGARSGAAPERPSWSSTPWKESRPVPRTACC